MACSVPCVTSHTGGLPELVKEGISGYTAPVGDVDKMAEHVLAILDNESEYEKLAKSTREYAFDNFHVNKIIPQYVSLYEKI